MAKKVFERIWKTINIIINTIFAGLMSVYIIATIFDSGHYDADTVSNIFVVFMVLIGINLIDNRIRKHFMNY